MENKRMRQRVNFQSSIEIDTEDGKKNFEKMNNISMSGFFLVTDREFDINTEYDFVLKLECGENVINIVGKCMPRRITASGDQKKIGVGFKITDLEPESSEELFNVIKFNTID